MKLQRKIALLVSSLLMVTSLSYQVRAEQTNGPLTFKVSKADLERYKSKRKHKDALDVEGPLPFEEEVTIAIDATTRMLLKKQKKDGSWDMVEKIRAGLDKTADEAVDPIVMTSLCAMALRTHQEVNPEAIEEAVQKALHFVIDRINRGKLSTTVMYACWRYGFGLQFLNMEYNYAKDNTKKQIYSTVERMLTSILGMQLTSRGTQSAMIQYSRPANLGLVVGTTKDNNHGMINKVLKDGAGDKAGLKDGDVIVSINSVRISNFYNYYEQELSYFDGDKLDFKILRDGKLVEVKVEVLPQFPGNLGFYYSENYDKKGEMLVDGFEFLSDADDVGVEEGDAIISINGQKVYSETDIEKIEEKCYSGHKVKMKIRREGKEHDYEFSLVPKPSSNFRVEVYEDDKEGTDGVKIKNFYRNSNCKAAGLQKYDRIIRVDHIPVMGMDHFHKLEAALWENKMVTIEYQKFMGKNKEPITKTVEVKLNSKTAVSKSTIRGYHGINLPNKSNVDAIVDSVDDSSPAAIAGLKKGDKIYQINGKQYKTAISVYNRLFNNTIGNKTVIVVKRDGKDKTIKFVMGRQPSPWAVPKEENAGGWNYYSFVGGSNTFVTASILRAMMDIEKNMKIDIPKDAMKRAYKVFEHARVKNPKAAAETYSYDIANRFPDIAYRGHMGRSNSAELTSVMYCDRGYDNGGVVRNMEHLKKSLRQWLDLRYELDKVRKFKGTHDQKNYNNAAYYWMYSHRTTAIAANYIDDKVLARELKETILKALMLTIIKEKSCWLGHHSFGPLNGTANALITLGQLKDLYGKRIKLPHPKIQMALDQFKLAHYGEAYSAAMIAKVSSEVLEGKRDTALAAQADALVSEIQKRYEGRIKVIQERFEYNPFDALIYADNFQKVFTGHPNQILIKNLIKKWEEDPKLEAYKTYGKKLTALKKKHAVAMKNPMLTKREAKPIIEEFKKLISEYPKSNIAQQAQAILEFIEESFNGQGYLGITPDMRYKGEGIRIGVVQPNSAAAKAGIKNRDVVKAVDGKAIKDMEAFREALKGKKAEDEITLKIKRRGQDEFDLMVILARRVD